MWSFLNLGWKVNWHLWIVLLFLSLRNIAIFMAIGCILILISIVVKTFFLSPIIGILLLFIILIVLYVYYYLFASKLHLYELPLVVETDISARRSIDFSEQLVENENYSFLILVIISVFTVVFAIFMFCVGIVVNPLAEKIYDLIANSIFFITNLPVGAIFLLCLWFINSIYLYSTWLALVFVPFPTSIFFLSQPMISSGDKSYIFFILYPFISALFIPLWQSIKAVIYYRLKLRNYYRDLISDISS